MNVLRSACCRRPVWKRKTTGDEPLPWMQSIDGRDFAMIVAVLVDGQCARTGAQVQAVYSDEEQCLSKRGFPGNKQDSDDAPYATM